MPKNDYFLGEVFNVIRLGFRVFWGLRRVRWDVIGYSKGALWCYRARQGAVRVYGKFP